jgi:hypothetical protein
MTFWEEYEWIHVRRGRGVEKFRSEQYEALRRLRIGDHITLLRADGSGPNARIDPPDSPASGPWHPVITSHG